MLTLLLLTLALYVVQTFIPPMFMSRAHGPEALRHAGGPRDTALTPSKNAGRALRALGNMNEALFVFIPLALASLHYGLDSGLAWWGAFIFLLARIVYVPAYILAIGPIRSIVWTIGHVGLALMATALLKTL